VAQLLHTLSQTDLSQFDLSQFDLPPVFLCPLATIAAEINRVLQVRVD
jgi:hypothetical protein